jgi:CRISPR-associated protein Csb2
MGETSGAHPQAKARRLRCEVGEVVYSYAHDALDRSEAAAVLEVAAELTCLGHGVDLAYARGTITEELPALENPWWTPRPAASARVGGVMLRVPLEGSLGSLVRRYALRAGRRARGRLCWQSGCAGGRLFLRGKQTRAPLARGRPARFERGRTGLARHRGSDGRRDDSARASGKSTGRASRVCCWTCRRRGVQRSSHVLGVVALHGIAAFRRAHSPRASARASRSHRRGLAHLHPAGGLTAARAARASARAARVLPGGRWRCPPIPGCRQRLGVCNASRSSRSHFARTRFTHGHCRGQGRQAGQARLRLAGCPRSR